MQTQISWSNFKSSCVTKFVKLKVFHTKSNSKEVNGGSTGGSLNTKCVSLSFWVLIRSVLISSVYACSIIVSIARVIYRPSCICLEAHVKNMFKSMVANSLDFRQVGLCVCQKISVFVLFTNELKGKYYLTH